MRVLIACEFSGVVRRAFRAKNHEAYSCDILPSEDASPFHFQKDVAGVLLQQWDLLISHPPCTFLTNAGVRHLHSIPTRTGKLPKIHGAARWLAMRSAALFFKTFLDSTCPRIAIENPIPHKYALEIIGRKYDQLIQPWMFGCGETKATCLWLKGLPPLQRTHRVDDLFCKQEPIEREHRIHKLPPSPDRAKLRSVTFQGIAEAMADQWG